MPSPIPEQFGRYRVLRLLGQGGMGAVYLAQDGSLGREVALKIPSLDGPDSDQMVERFYREARSAATLHHPNICPVYDVGEIDGKPYLTMRYIEGRPLTKFINPENPQNPRNVAVVIRKLALALAEAHAHGVVHRDLKPANIMIDSKNEPIVMDFGLARQMGGANEKQVTQSGMIVGTPAYMSPEQIVADPAAIDHRTDIWSLGVILFEMLTGQLPYDGSVLQIVGAIQHVEPPLASDRRPALPEKIVAICRKMMTRDKTQRYQSMTEVAADLAAFQKSAATGSPMAGATSDGALQSMALPRTGNEPHTQTPRSLAGSLESGAGVSASRTKTTVTPREGGDAGALATLMHSIVRSSKALLRGRRKSRSGRVGSIADRWGMPAAVVGVLLLIAAIYALSSRNNKPTASPNETNRATTAFASGRQPSTVNPEPSPGWQGWPADAPPPAIAPFTADNAKAHQEAWARHLGVPVEWENSIGMKFRLIPPGEFLMGSTAEEVSAALQTGEENSRFPEKIRSEAPRRRVVISRPFYLGKFEVTHKQFAAVMPADHPVLAPGKEVSQGLGGRIKDDWSAESVTWFDAQEFCNELSRREQLDPFQLAFRDQSVSVSGHGYHLPSEAQWEYACRAGTTTEFWLGDNEGELTLVDSFRTTSPEFESLPGVLQPNPFGICDTHCKVSEWVWDAWDAAGYESVPGVDPWGSLSGDPRRVLRGGLWGTLARFARSGMRDASAPGVRMHGVGFRAAVSAEAVKQGISGGQAPQPVPPPAMAPTGAATAQAQVEVINRLTAKGFQFTVEIDRQWQQVTQTLTLPEQFDVFRVLTAATWQNNQATEQDFDELRVFPDLQEIGLNYFAVSADLLGRLAKRHPKLPSLRLGELDMNLAQAASVAKFLELRNLSIHKCSKLTAKGLQSWASLTKLQSLTLGESSLTDRDLEQFPTWPELTALSLYGPRVDGHGVRDLPTKCPRLIMLDLHGCWLVGSQLAWLGQLPLEELKLSLGTTHDMRLDHLPPLPKLKKMMFSVSGRYGQQNKVVPQFSEFRSTEIDWLTSCPELSELEVQSLTDRQLAQLAAVQSVQRLTVNGNGVTNISPQTLAALQTLPKLVYLYLVNCQLNDAHAPVLARFERLAGLMLAMNKLTPSGMKQIRAGLPRCQISTDVPE